MNIYWKIACAAALVIAGFSSGWYINGNRMGKQIAAIEKAHADEQAQIAEQIRMKERAYQLEISKQAETYQTAVSATSKDLDKLKQELASVKKTHPIDCTIGADRLRIIKQAGQRANDTAAR